MLRVSPLKYPVPRAVGDTAVPSLWSRSVLGSEARRARRANHRTGQHSPGRIRFGSALVTERGRERIRQPSLEKPWSVYIAECQSKCRQRPQRGDGCECGCGCCARKIPRIPSQARRPGFGFGFGYPRQTKEEAGAPTPRVRYRVYREEPQIPMGRRRAVGGEEGSRESGIGNLVGVGRLGSDGQI